MTKLYTFLCIILVSLILPSGWAFAANPLSAFDLHKPSTFSSVELSPNGQYVAYVEQKMEQFCLDGYGRMVSQDIAECEDDEKNYRTIHKIWIYDIQSNKRIRYFDIPKNFLVSWLKWGNEERILTAIRRPTTSNEKGTRYAFGGSRILSIPLEGSDYVALFEGDKKVSRQNINLTSVTSFLRHDPEHIIMPARKGGHLDLWKVNIMNGSLERIATGRQGTFFWFTDKAGAPVMRFDCYGRGCRKVKVYKPQGQDQKWKKIRTFKVKPDEDQEDYDFWPIAQTDIKGQYYVFSEEETDSRRSVKIFDVNTNEFIRTVYEHPKYDVSGAILNLQTSNYAGVYFYEDRLNYDFVDPTMQKHFNALNKFFKNEQNVDVLGYNSDGTQAVFYVSSPTNPGEYYVYDFNKKRIDILFARKSELVGKITSRSDILSIPMRDGKTITAYHYYPQSGAGSNVPLLIWPHGGPEQRDYFDYDRNIQYFVSRGYQVLTMNFRGSGGYGRDFGEAGYGEWGGLMQDDVTDSIKYIYNQGKASADNACIVGYSYGGYVALQAASTTPELIKCAVSGGGVSDILADLKQTKNNYGPDSESYQYWLKSMGDPKVNKDKIKSKSPINTANNFEDPVLLIHGEYDGIVDVEQSEAMHKALKKAGKPVQYLELEGEGHYDWEIKNDMLYLETIDTFLSQHLTGQVK